MIQTIFDFFTNGTTQEITRNILGKQLIYYGPNGLVGGYIVEAEAYLGQQDKGAHAYQGHRSPRNEALYHGPGTIYLHQMHGQILIDLVAQEVEIPHGVLIRAIEPVTGLPLMLLNRPQSGPNLTNGPGKLAQAFGIPITLNLATLNESALVLDLVHMRTPQQICTSPRIGINNKGEWSEADLRFYVAGNPYVSKIKKSDVDFANHGWQ